MISDGQVTKICDECGSEVAETRLYEHQLLCIDCLLNELQNKDEAIFELEKGDDL